MNPRWFCLQGTRVQFLVQVLKESSPLCQEQTVDVSVLGSLCSSSSSLIVIPVTNVNFANPPRTLIPLYLRRPRCCRRSSSVVDVCCPWQSMPAIRFPFCGISSIIPWYWPHPRPVFRHHGLEDPSKTSSQALRRFPCLCRCFVTMGLETPTKLHSSLPSQPVVSSFTSIVYSQHSSSALATANCLLSSMPAPFAPVAPSARQFGSITSPPHRSVSVCSWLLSRARCRF